MSQAENNETNETKSDRIKEKTYITKEIETSITLLGSSEINVILESLLFLSKYAEIEENNLILLQSSGLLPKLLALLEHNICILKVSLRLLSQLLTIDAAKLELNQEIFDGEMLKICKFFVTNNDVIIKSFSCKILEVYVTLGKAEVLLAEPKLINTILNVIKTPATDTMLDDSLTMFSKLLELKMFRTLLYNEIDFDLSMFLTQMKRSVETSQERILAILEKLTYFSDDNLQNKVRQCSLLGYIINIVVDSNKTSHLVTGLTIILHSMRNENTQSYFVELPEFLSFCHWIKRCPDSAFLLSSKIVLKLSKINSIRQILYDLSFETVVVLLLLRSDNKSTFDVNSEAVSYMSKHKYSCQKLVCSTVIQKLLAAFQSLNDCTNSALRTLLYLCRRNSKTIHLICRYNGIAALLNIFEQDCNESILQKLFEIINIFITNYQLRRLVLSDVLFEAVLTNIQSECDEVCKKSLEIMINCLNVQEFRNYFLSKRGCEIISKKLQNTVNEDMVLLLVVFIHSCLMYEDLSCGLIHQKTFLILKELKNVFEDRLPLIETTKNLIFNKCLPVKFFETGRLNFTDKLNKRFYLITGTWTECFPFLEVLEIRQMSTMNTIYVLDLCESSDCDSQSNDSFAPSECSCYINFGKLSHDSYLPIYQKQVLKLLQNEINVENKIKVLAKFVNRCLCGSLNIPITDSEQKSLFKQHIDSLKAKLGTNMIPLGYVRLGFYCERAVLFKTLADYCHLTTSLVKYSNDVYYNEIALLQTMKNKVTIIKIYVVDLIKNIGQLLPLESKGFKVYCNNL